MISKNVKNLVYSYWNRQSCGTAIATAQKFSQEYFEQIEDYRYKVEPEIFSFAQFTRYNKKKVLEIGVGVGTDFIQWVRSGADAYGIDLTSEAIEHVQKRLSIYGLFCKECKVADVENLPYPDNYFDLVYSWGVIHHTPDTIKALDEIIRVTRIGGGIKLMVYNRRSLSAFYKYLRYGLFQGKPFRSISDVLYFQQESRGTKAFTMSGIKTILSNYPVKIENLSARVTNYDLLWNFPLPFRIFAYILACFLGYNKCGWFMTIEMKKIPQNNMDIKCAE